MNEYIAKIAIESSLPPQETLALANGAAIDDVATVMGHEDITMAYTHYRKWIKTAADRLRASLDTIGKERAA